MGKGKLFACGVLVSLLFCLPKVALSQHEARPVPLAKPLHVNDIAIPASLGYVLEATQPTAAGPSGPIVIHIQEAHTNYEAQKNIVAILDQLVKEHGLRLILVEGGEGDVSLAYLRKYGPPENRREVAEKYLKAGIISAEEYLDIVSDFPLTLWGVEQERLYDQNVEAFLAVESLQQSLRPLLGSVQETVDALKARLADPLLNELEDKVKAFDRHQLNLVDYATALQQVALRRQVSLKDFPHVQRFLEAHHLEQTIQQADVQREQQQLIGELSNSAPEDQLEQLVSRGLEMKEGKVTPIVFYRFLEQLASSSKIAWPRYPRLRAYIDYLTQNEQIDPTALAGELDRVVAALRTSLSASPERQALSRIAEEVDLVQKLLSLRLSPDEHARFKTLTVEGLASRWEQFLTSTAAQHGISAGPVALDALEQHLPTLARFYEVAQQRDEVLVRNTVAKLRESNDHLAVLITGGFHSASITRLLKEEGLGTVVLTPKVGQSTDEALYRAVLKYKSGHGSLDDVLAIANKN